MTPPSNTWSHRSEVSMRIHGIFTTINVSTHHHSRTGGVSKREHVKLDFQTLYDRQYKLVMREYRNRSLSSRVFYHAMDRVREHVNETIRSRLSPDRECVWSVEETAMYLSVLDAHTVKSVQLFIITEKVSTREKK